MAKIIHLREPSNPRKGTVGKEFPHTQKIEEKGGGKLLIETGDLRLLKAENQQWEIKTRPKVTRRDKIL